MIKTLSPIIDKDAYSDPIEKVMVQGLWEAIFLPIFKILGLKTPKKVNSLADLRTELRAGRIYYWDGYFYGKFNSSVGKTLRDLGASFDSRKKGYKLHLSKIPQEVRTDIVLGKAVNRNKTEEILDALNELDKTKLIVGSGAQAVATMDELNLQANRSLKILPESLMIPLDLQARQKKELLSTYQQGLEASIGDWKSEAIERLRQKTTDNAQLGYRADRLAEVVKSEFSINEKKAKFLARQETARFVSKYRELRYKDAGINSYIWSTSHDERVRQDHRELNGKVFSWDSPPIVDRHTGRTANPGEDWNCRCVARPVIRIGA